MMSSENFESLEDDFLSLKTKIKNKLDNDVSRTWGENRKNTLREIQRDMDEVQHILVEMENEAKAAPLPYRTRMLATLKTYEQELSQIKRKITVSEESSLTTSKRELFSTNRSDPSVANAENNRNNMLQINKTIQRTSERVFHAQQVAAETEQVGIAVVDELGTQRETLLRTKERLVDTDANLTRSRRILKSMYRKVITNKMCLIVIIVLELGILGGEVYYKFFLK